MIKQKIKSTAKFSTKNLSKALLEILPMALSVNKSDEAQAMLNALKIIYPDHTGFGLLEVFVYINKNQWIEAASLARELNEKNNDENSKILLTYCLYKSNDQEYIESLKIFLEKYKKEDLPKLIYLISENKYQNYAFRID